MQMWMLLPTFQALNGTDTPPPHSYWLLQAKRSQTARDAGATIPTAAVHDAQVCFGSAEAGALLLESVNRQLLESDVQSGLGKVESRHWNW